MADDLEPTGDLRVDEVHVPPLHELPDSWERNNAFLDYLLLKRSGWIGRTYVGALLLFIFVGMWFQWDWLGFTVMLLGALTVGVGAVRAWSSRRRI